MCSPLVSQSIDQETWSRPRHVPEAVIVVGRELIVMSNPILQSIERDERLRLWNLIFLAEVCSSVTLLHTAIELGGLQWLLGGHFRQNISRDSQRILEESKVREDMFCVEVDVEISLTIPVTCRC